MRDYRLSPDPGTSDYREVAEVSGHAAKLSEASKVAPVIHSAAYPSLSLAAQLAGANETIGILRDLLSATASALSKLAETITVDTGQAAVRGALRADEMRRFS